MSNRKYNKKKTNIHSILKGEKTDRTGTDQLKFTIC